MRNFNNTVTDRSMLFSSVSKQNVVQLPEPGHHSKVCFFNNYVEIANTDGEVSKANAINSWGNSFTPAYCICIFLIDWSRGWKFSDWLNSRLFFHLPPFWLPTVLAQSAQSQLIIKSSETPYYTVGIPRILIIMPRVGIIWRRQMTQMTVVTNVTKHCKRTKYRDACHEKKQI